jgi:hypothetical protein
MLDWDTTSIVFTKRTLIEFLKYTGITVDTNLTNIQKLPRYARFGKISEPAPLTLNEDETTSSTTVHSVTGGDSHKNIFNDSDDLNVAKGPPSNSATRPADVDEEAESGINFPSKVKPSRRVRTVPGGPSSLSSILANESYEEEFKPTRRVTQRPGGQDNVAGLF